jgi:hypothetical protein
MFDYPIQFHVKKSVLSRKCTALDYNGKEIAFLSKNRLGFERKISLYNNSKKEETLLHLKAEKIWDIDDVYSFHTPSKDTFLGKLSRKYITSTLWRSRYEMQDAKENLEWIIIEENPWARITSSVMSKIKRGQYLSKYFLKPTYQVLLSDEVVIGEVTEKQSFFKRELQFNLFTQLSKDNELKVLGSLMLLMILEKK